MIKKLGVELEVYQDILIIEVHFYNVDTYPRWVKLLSCATTWSKWNKAKQYCHTELRIKLKILSDSDIIQW